MNNHESSVTKAVRETVVKAAEKIENLRDKSKPFTEEIKQDLSEAGREAVKLSGMAVDTAVATTKDAFKGLKEGIEEVRKKKKSGK